MHGRQWGTQSGLPSGRSEKFAKTTDTSVLRLSKACNRIAPVRHTDPDRFDTRSTSVQATPPAESIPQALPAHNRFPSWVSALGRLPLLTGHMDSDLQFTREPPTRRGAPSLAPRHLVVPPLTYEVHRLAGDQFGQGLANACDRARLTLRRKLGVRLDSEPLAHQSLPFGVEPAVACRAARTASGRP